MTRYLFLAAAAAVSMQVCNAQTPSSSFSTLSFNDLYGYATSIKAPGPADRDAHNMLTRSLLLKGWPVTSWDNPVTNGITYYTQVYTYSVDSKDKETLRLSEEPFNGYKFAVNLRASTQDLGHYLEWFHAAMALQGFNIDPVAGYPSSFTFRSAAGPHNAAPKNIIFQPEFTANTDHGEATKPFTYTVTIQIVR